VTAPKKKPPRAKRVVVVFNELQDPTPAQRRVLQKTLDEVKQVRVLKEFPGAVSLEVEPEAEAPLRSAIRSLDDWNMSDEGAARMPNPPMKEDE
jgi:hypothetical protein